MSKLREAIEILTRTADELERVLPWQTVRVAHPPPQSRYLVRRDGMIHTATPCYGMHAPWWVVRTMEGEAPPVPMRDDDEWQELRS